MSAPKRLGAYLNENEESFGRFGAQVVQSCASIRRRVYVAEDLNGAAKFGGETEVERI